VTIRLETPSLRQAGVFLAAVRRSRSLHRGLVAPPRTRAAYQAYLARLRRPTHAGYFICVDGGELAGVVNLNEIVRGAFQSAYLGFYAFAPHVGRGHMRAGLARVIGRAFGALRLHRLEVNVQPHNLRSIALVRGLGFRREGLSPRYLKISGRWRDHERWAITAERWKAGKGVTSANRT
jgi:ribosomal-protein-alanine N-acetyltransferase